MSYKIGSLFDGSGGFPLAGSLCGIEPTWASENEPYPVAVTKSRFPSMKHLGSVTDINGADIEPVDVITFGSPCQDLSVAGKRAGLKHEDNGDDETTRSGLFMEAVRIIKEMRKATNGKYPTFAVWENVPGAFSSNKGEDFRIVLEELVKIVEPCASIPAAGKNGWSYADAYMGDGWSIAYRVLDAQYWGVPQRRRRIYLVLDITGQRAGEILLKPDGLRGHFTESGTPWQGTAADAQGSTGTADREGAVGLDGIALDKESRPLGFDPHGANDFKEPKVVCVKCYESHPMDSRVKELDDDVSPTVSVKWHKGAADTPLVCTKEQYLFENHSRDTRFKGPLDVSPMLPAQLGTGGDNTPFVVEKEQSVLCMATQQGGAEIMENTCPTITAAAGMSGNNQPVVCVQEPFVKSARARSADDATTWKHGDVANTFNTFDMGETRANELVVEGVPVYCLQGNGIDRADTAGCNGKGWREDACYTLNTIDRPAVAYAIGNGQADNTRLHRIPGALNCMHDQQAVLLVEDPKPIDLNRAFYNQGQNAQYDPQFYTDGTVPTLVAKDPGAVCVRYIVRRLTPTECARLQGFPDWWGEIDEKEDFAEEEYQFWLNVRNTHAAINGKPTKDYTKPQMLTWYNKLHTDSSEYKMWGNGIALPCALYVMQGIADALGIEERTK